MAWWWILAHPSYMKRPSCTSATQPVKTVKAMHRVFMAVVRAFASTKWLEDWTRLTGSLDPYLKEIIPSYSIWNDPKTVVDCFLIHLWWGPGVMVWTTVCQQTCLQWWEPHSHGFAQNLEGRPLIPQRLDLVLCLWFLWLHNDMLIFNPWNFRIAHSCFNLKPHAGGWSQLTCASE